MRLPRARSDDLVVEELGDELLVYDLTNDRAHSLSATAARVWRACDGSTTVEDLGAGHDLDPDTVRRSLDELGTCALLDSGIPSNGGATRRELTLRVAKVGAVAAAAPLIVSVLAPTPSQAATPPTEEFCQSINVTGHGCGECHKFGCCCCEPPGTTNSSVTKPCHADCAAPDCNLAPAANCNGSTDNCKQKP